jgi:hypothetical protein
MGFMNVPFTPVETVTSKADQIYQKVKATIDGLGKQSIAPGLKPSPSSQSKAANSGPNYRS